MTSDPQKIALVTGGGRGIGRAIVARFLADGFGVVTCGRGAPPSDLDARVTWVQADVAQPGEANRLVAIASEQGPLHCVVNNAGVQVEKTVGDATDEDWDLVLNVNCRGVFNVSRAALPALTESGGSIVNLGSMAGDVAEPGMALYNASKAFVHALTRSTAVDHGPAVRCNAVSPGWILTELTDSAFAVARDPEQAKQDALARHPAGRLGDPEDVADVVAWLASDAARYVNGQCVTIDGGLTAGSPIRPSLF